MGALPHLVYDVLLQLSSLFLCFPDGLISRRSLTIHLHLDLSQEPFTHRLSKLRLLNIRHRVATMFLN